MIADSWADESTSWSQWLAPTVMVPIVLWGDQNDPTRIDSGMGVAAWHQVYHGSQGYHDDASWYPRWQQADHVSSSAAQVPQWRCAGNALQTTNPKVPKTLPAKNDVGRPDVRAPPEEPEVMEFKPSVPSVPEPKQPSQEEEQRLIGELFFIRAWPLVCSKAGSGVSGIDAEEISRICGKTVGMLLQLPRDEQKELVGNFRNLQSRVREALQVLAPTNAAGLKDATPATGTDQSVPECPGPPSESYGDLLYVAVSALAGSGRVSLTVTRMLLATLSAEVLKKCLVEEKRLRSNLQTALRSLERDQREEREGKQELTDFDAMSLLERATFLQGADGLEKASRLLRLSVKHTQEPAVVGRRVVEAASTGQLLATPAFLHLCRRCGVDRPLVKSFGLRLANSASNTKSVPRSKEPVPATVQTSVVEMPKEGTSVPTPEFQRAVGPPPFLVDTSLRKPISKEEATAQREVDEAIWAAVDEVHSGHARDGLMHIEPEMMRRNAKKRVSSRERTADTAIMTSELRRNLDDDVPKLEKGERVPGLLLSRSAGLRSCPTEGVLEPDDVPGNARATDFDRNENESQPVRLGEAAVSESNSVVDGQRTSRACGARVIEAPGTPSPWKEGAFLKVLLRPKPNEAPRNFSLRRSTELFPSLEVSVATAKKVSSASPAPRRSKSLGTSSARGAPAGWRALSLDNVELRAPFQGDASEEQQVPPRSALRDRSREPPASTLTDSKPAEVESLVSSKVSWSVPEDIAPLHASVPRRSASARRALDPVPEDRVRERQRGGDESRPGAKKKGTTWVRVSDAFGQARAVSVGPTSMRVGEFASSVAGRSTAVAAAAGAEASEEIQNAFQRLVAIAEEKMQAVEREDFEQAAKLKVEEHKLKRLVSQHPSSKSWAHIASGSGSDQGRIARESGSSGNLGRGRTDIARPLTTTRPKSTRGTLTFFLHAPGSLDAETFKPSTTHFARRDALARIVSAALWRGRGLMWEDTNEIAILFEDDGLLRISPRFVANCPVPSEFHLISVIGRAIERGDSPGIRIERPTAYSTASSHMHRLVEEYSKTGRTIVTLLHEQFEQNLAFYSATDDDTAEAPRSTLIFFLGAVKDMTGEEIGAVHHACRAFGVPCVEANLGQQPEFTSKIIDVLHGHHLHGRLMPAVVRCTKELGLDCVDPARGPRSQKRSAGTFWVFVPISGGPRDLAVDDRKRDGMYEIPRSCIAQLWCSKGEHSSHKLSFVFTAGEILTVRPSIVTCLKMQHRAAPTERNVVSALRVGFGDKSADPSLKVDDGCVTLAEPSKFVSCHAGDRLHAHRSVVVDLQLGDSASPRLVTCADVGRSAGDASIRDVVVFLRQAGGRDFPKNFRKTVMGIFGESKGQKVAGKPGVSTCSFSMPEMSVHAGISLLAHYWQMRVLVPGLVARMEEGIPIPDLTLASAPEARTPSII